MAKVLKVVEQVVELPEGRVIDRTCEYLLL